VQLLSDELRATKELLRSPNAEPSTEPFAASSTTPTNLATEQPLQQPEDRSAAVPTLELLRELVTEVVRAQLGVVPPHSRENRAQSDSNVQNPAAEVHKTSGKQDKRGAIGIDADEEDEDDDDAIDALSDALSDNGSLSPRRRNGSTAGHESLSERSFDRMESELRQALELEERKLVRMRLQYSSDKEKLQRERERYAIAHSVRMMRARWLNRISFETCRLLDAKHTLKRKLARKHGSKRASHDVSSKPYLSLLVLMP
jgi:hypothetical protein